MEGAAGGLRRNFVNSGLMIEGEQPHGLLGPKYVALSGGNFGTLREGATIPLSRTSTSVDLDQVLNTLQPDVRENLKVIFTELGKAADGRGANMNTAFRALGTGASDTATTTGVLRARSDGAGQGATYLRYSGLDEAAGLN